MKIQGLPNKLSETDREFPLNPTECYTWELNVIAQDHEVRNDTEFACDCGYCLEFDRRIPTTKEVK